MQLVVAEALPERLKVASSTRCSRMSRSVKSMIWASSGGTPRMCLSRIAVIVASGTLLAAGAARLGAPDVHRIEFARHRHRGEDAHPHIEAALEAHVGPQVGHAAASSGAWRNIEKGPCSAPAAADDAVDYRLVLGAAPGPCS